MPKAGIRFVVAMVSFSSLCRASLPVSTSTIFIGSVAAIALLTAATEAASSQSDFQLPDRLSKTESADFALAAERAELEPAYRKRGLGLNFEGAMSDPHFYSWTVIPSWGEGLVYFAIDRRTGDVWAYLGCELVQSQKLALLQESFRHRFNVSVWRVRQIEKRGFPSEDC
jgi:hypothetical protein